MLSHWPWFTWKFFMTYLQKNFELIFQKQPSCPKNMRTEFWRKLPTCELDRTFCFLNRTILYNLCKKLVDQVYFDLVRPFYFVKWNCYFSACENLPNFSCHFWKYKSVFFSKFPSIFSAIKHNSPLVF